jgi:hypothetical protein
MEALNASIKAAAKPGTKSARAGTPTKRTPARRTAGAKKKAPAKTAKQPARAKQPASRRKAS